MSDPSNLKCRQCKKPLTPETALFRRMDFRVHPLVPCKRPICIDCWKASLCCRICGRHLKEEAAEFVQADGKPARKPICEMCLDALKRRRDGVPEPGRGPCQYSPGFAARAYHGSLRDDT